MKNLKAFSLVEILIVLTIFSALAIVSTQAIIVTLSNSRKAESSVQTRESLQYVTSVMERSLRNSMNIESSTNNSIAFTDQDGAGHLFLCVDATPGSADGHLLFDSSRISSEDITLTNCTFSTVLGTEDVPDRVMVTISGQAKNTSGAEQTPITVSTIVYLRVY